MQKSVWTKGLVIGIIGFLIGMNIIPYILGINGRASCITGDETNFIERTEKSTIEKWIINSPSIPNNTSSSIVNINALLSDNFDNTVLLNNVPTSQWTYGCIPTTIGMLFGYYDRIGYNNMYSGPTNSGVCPLENLGQGKGSPIPGSCYIIATQKGLDGIDFNAHVDDYWKTTNSPGPDPWENTRPEHAWSLCVADFIGANQWKWDIDNDGKKDSNIDGSATYWTNTDGSKLYDYIPSASHGLPQTECGHGCKLFAQSRGYAVNTVYNQLTATPRGNRNGFTFSEFQAEINAGRPVITYWISNSGRHSMLGVGYDSATSTIYLHDTWDNELHQCSWSGRYSGDNYELEAVTVLQLTPLPANRLPSVPSNPNPSTHSDGIKVDTILSWTCDDPNGDWMTYDVYFGTESPPPFITSVEINSYFNPGKMNFNTTYYWKIVAKDCRGGSTSGPIWNFTSGGNKNPNTPTITGKINGSIATSYEYYLQTTDPDQDDVKYYVDWGDNTFTTTGLNTSGKQVVVSHTWNTEGTYIIKVKSIDRYDAESNWETLTVTMPYSYVKPIPNFYDLFFQRFPNAFPLLRYLMGY
jgi:hypothetical protein